MAKKHYEYEHGAPISEIMCLELDDAKNRIMNERKASAILVDGGVGQGKTTLAVHLAEYYQDKPLVFDEQLAMGGKDFMEKMKVCYKKGHRVIIYDEAGDFSSKRSVTSFNHYLNRVFDVYRAFRILVIIVLPSFKHIDRGLLDKQIIRVLYHCQNRNKKYGSIKAFDLWKMFFLKDRMNKLVVTPSAYALEKPVYYGQFLDLKPERMKELDRYTVSGKMDIVGDVQIKEEGLISTDDIIKKLPEPRTKRWLYGKLKELNIKPTKKYKRKNYYHHTIVQQLTEVMN